MPRSNILLKRLMAPKKVQLPNGLVFHAKHQMVSRNVLPKRICAPVLATAAGNNPFTAACVPTGMNAGVSKAP